MKRYIFRIPAAVLIATGVAKLLANLVDFKLHCADCGTTKGVKSYRGGELFLCESCKNVRFERAWEAWQYNPEHIRLSAERQAYGYMFLAVILFGSLIISGILSQIFGLIGYLPLAIVLASFAYVFAKLYYERHIKPNPKWLRDTAISLVLIILTILIVVGFIDGTHMRIGTWIVNLFLKAAGG